MAKNNGLDGLLDAIMQSAATAEVVAVGGRRKSEDYNVTISSDAQVMELSAFLRDYRQRFSVGAYITPKPNTGSRGAGQPHIVLETNYDADPIFVKDGAGTARNGRRNEIRVACYVDDETIAMFWVEAVDYEPWVKPEGE